MWQVAETSATALLGLFAMAAVFEGYHLKPLGWIERTFFLGVTVLLLWPSLATHGAGVLLFISLCFWQKMGVGTTVVTTGENKEQTSIT
jgi:TRAP-type uncharacterized transport system fused permease subunit